jgi:hypothetical protein
MFIIINAYKKSISHLTMFYERSVFFGESYSSYSILIKYLFSIFLSFFGSSSSIQLMDSYC